MRRRSFLLGAAALVSMLVYIGVAGYTHWTALSFAKGHGAIAPSTRESSLLAVVVVDQIFNVITFIVLCAFTGLALRVAVSPSVVRIGRAVGLVALSQTPLAVWSIMAFIMSASRLDGLDHNATGRALPGVIVARTLVGLSKDLMVTRVFAHLLAMLMLAWLLKYAEGLRWRVALAIAFAACASVFIVGRLFSAIA